MRSFFLLLLAANLCYFFWKVTTEVPLVPKELGLTLEELKILPTSKQPVKTDIRATLPKVEAEVVIKTCYMVGDFETNSLAEKAMDVLVVAFPITQEMIKVVKHSRLISDYWVVYPAEDSWQKSKSNVEKIRNKGIKELWLVPNGEDKGVVSLGLFQNQEPALLRAKSLKEMGLDVKVITRQVERPVYRVLFEVPAVKKAVESLIRDKFDTKEIKIEEISC